MDAAQNWVNSGAWLVDASLDAKAQEWAKKTWCRPGALNRVAVDCGSPVVGAAVKSFLAGDSFFLRQVDAAMGASDHLRWGGWIGILGRLGWIRSAPPFDRPNDDQYQQQDQQVFHPKRPSMISKTKREPA